MQHFEDDKIGRPIKLVGHDDPGVEDVGDPVLAQLGQLTEQLKVGNTATAPGSRHGPTAVFPF